MVRNRIVDSRQKLKFTVYRFEWKSRENTVREKIVNLHKDWNQPETKFLRL